MKWSYVCMVTGAVTVGAVSALALSGRTSRLVANAPSVVAAVPDVIAAGPGRVEPVSEEVRVAAQIGGILSEVLLDEGDSVAAGQVIARIEAAEYVARASAADAELQIREAEARRVLNGARDQERDEVAAAVREAEAVVDHDRADLQRLRELAREGVISQQELGRGEQAARVAQARLDAAQHRARFITDEAREEDVSRADAAVARARARVEEVRALLAKTSIRSPINGVVLRRHRKAGETVSTQFDSPIVTIADRSSVRVVVDVDETDVARVAVGQPAYVTADAFGSRRFRGRVVRVGQMLGRKNVRTDEPSERVDTKILETLVQLDDGHELPIGLRVQAFVTAAR